MLKSRFVVGLNAHNNPFLPIWRNHPNETLVEYWICSFLGAIWRVSNMTRGKESVVGIPAKIKILTGEHPTPTPHRVSWPWTPCAPQLRQETKKAPRPSSMWILETLERLTTWIPIAFFEWSPPWHMKTDIWHLTYILAFYLLEYIWHLFGHSMWHKFWHTIWHSIWYMLAFWHIQTLHLPHILTWKI